METVVVGDFCATQTDNDMTRMIYESCRMTNAEGVLRSSRDSIKVPQYPCMTSQLRPDGLLGKAALEEFCTLTPGCALIDDPSNLPRPNSAVKVPSSPSFKSSVR